MNEFEYYIVERDGSQAYPLISTNGDYPHTMMYIRTKGKIEHPNTVYFAFDEPAPINPIIGDYFSQPESVVSKKIKEILEPLSIDGIQLIPAIVTSNNGDDYEDYYYIHIHNYIEAMDKEKSIYEKRPRFYSIDSFVLDNKVLEKITLEKRLIFKLQESSSNKIYHKSIVDVIMSVNPSGLKFTKVEDWRL